MIPFSFRARLSNLQKASAFILAAVLLVGVVLTQARMALGAIGVTTIVAAILLARARMLALLGAGGLVATATIVWMRFGIERVKLVVSDIGIRSKIYGIGTDLFQENPLLGIGHGMYRNRATAIREADWSASYLVDAHQLYLHVLVESGVLGFVGFAMMLGFTMWELTRRVRMNRSADGINAVMDRIAFFSLFAFMVLGLFHYPLHHAPVALAFWFMIGMARYGAISHETPIVDSASPGESSGGRLDT